MSAAKQLDELDSIYRAAGLPDPTRVWVTRVCDGVIANVERTHMPDGYYHGLDDGDWTGPFPTENRAMGAATAYYAKRLDSFMVIVLEEKGAAQ